MATEIFDTSIDVETRNQYNFRQILIEDFKSLNGYVPIKGGWGYTLDDLIIIEKKDEVVNNQIPFDFVGLEYVLVEKRIYEELIIFKGEGDKYSELSWDLQFQKLLNVDGKTIDHLNFKVTCYKDESIPFLKEDFKKILAGKNTVEQYKNYKDSLQLFYFTDYYFDISSFYVS
jgi:hypothetical protein